MKTFCKFSHAFVQNCVTLFFDKFVIFSLEHCSCTERYFWPFSMSFLLERKIVPLDRHFVVYPWGAGVDKGAGLDEGDLFYTGLFYTGCFTSSSLDRCRRRRSRRRKKPGEVDFSWPDGRSRGTIIRSLFCSHTA